MLDSFSGIFAACVFGLVCFPGAYLFVLAIERYMDSCPHGPNRKECDQ